MEQSTQHANLPATASTQPADLLPGMAAQLEELGIGHTVGFGDLTRREQKYVLEYLETGNQTEAARRAGYSSPASDGSKVKNHAGVAKVLAQVSKLVAKDADQLIKRVSERSRALHADIQAERARPETLRNEARLLKLCAQADRTDSLLGTLLGKGIGVHLSGEMHHTHENTVAIPPGTLMAMAHMRREIIAPGRS